MYTTFYSSLAGEDDWLKGNKKVCLEFVVQKEIPRQASYNSYRRDIEHRSLYVDICMERLTFPSRKDTVYSRGICTPQQYLFLKRAWGQVSDDYLKHSLTRAKSVHLFQFLRKKLSDVEELYILDALHNSMRERNYELTLYIVQN